MPAKFQLEKASVLSLAGRPEFREAEDHLAKRNGPSAGGLKALRPWVVPVCSKHNGATLPRSLFTKRDLLD
jgi:hypothetical protein